MPTGLEAVEHGGALAATASVLYMDATERIVGNGSDKYNLVGKNRTGGLRRGGGDACREFSFDEIDGDGASRAVAGG